MSEQKWPDNLYIVRHGQSRRNVDREKAKAAGAHADFSQGIRDQDTPLTPFGETQGLSVGVELRKRHPFLPTQLTDTTWSRTRKIDVLYVSPYLRTRQTGAKLVEGLGYTPKHIIYDERIREIEFGLLDGLDRRGNELPQVWSALVLGLQDYVRKCGFTAASFETEIAYADFEKCEGTFKFQLTDVVIGLSGGIDSALVSAIAVEALGASHVTCITMPSEFSSEGSIKDSVAFADGHGVRLLMIPIEGIKTSLLDAFSKKKEAPVHDPSFHSQPYWADMGMRLSPLADENVQARIRGTILMSYSNTTRALVLSTGNKSETAVGYCTLYGDMCGGLSVIADVPKTTVYTLARWYNDRAKLHASVCSSKVLAATIEARQIPENTITKAPSAELAPGQYDQQSLPPYEILDTIIQCYVEERMSEEDIALGMRHVDRAVIHKVLGLIDRAEYKRQQAAPTLKVTSKAWFGRFMPIAKRSLYR